MNSNNSNSNNDNSMNSKNNIAGPASSQRPAPMTLRQLYEAAALDSFGLLDESEVDALDHAFAAAHPAIQTQIASLQARLVHSGLDGLSDAAAGEPSPGMRERVLKAVAAEIAASRLDADIRDHVDRDPSVVGRLGVAGMVTHVASAGPNYRQRVHYLWRASAIGSMAAVAFLTVSTFMLRSEFIRIEAASQTSQASSTISSYGATFETALLNPESRLVQFTVVRPTPGENRGVPAALVIYDASTSPGHLIARDVARSSEGLQLVLLDEAGQPVKVLAPINGSRAAFAFSAELAPGTALGIMPVGGSVDSLVLKSKGSVSGLAMADVWAAFRSN